MKCIPSGVLCCILCLSFHDTHVVSQIVRMLQIIQHIVVVLLFSTTCSTQVKLLKPKNIFCIANFFLGFSIQHILVTLPNIPISKRQVTLDRLFQCTRIRWVKSQSLLLQPFFNLNQIPLPL